MLAASIIFGLRGLNPLPSRTQELLCVWVTEFWIGSSLSVGNTMNCRAQLCAACFRCLARAGLISRLLSSSQVAIAAIFVFLIWCFCEFLASFWKIPFSFNAKILIAPNAIWLCFLMAQIRLNPNTESVAPPWRLRILVLRTLWSLCFLATVTYCES